MAPKNEKGYCIYLKEELRRRAAVAQSTSGAMVQGVMACFRFNSCICRAIRKLAGNYKNGKQVKFPLPQVQIYRCDLIVVWS